MTNNQNTPILYFNGTIYGNPGVSAVLCRNETIHSICKQKDFNADFPVLDKDLRSIHPEEILDTQVKMTIVNRKKYIQNDI